MAGDGTLVFAALAGGGKTSIEAYRGTTRAWQVELPGTGGTLATAGGLVYAVIARSGAPLRGEPGAELHALDATTGAERWQLPVDATRWSVITALAASRDGVIAGGSFAGTLRASDKVVASAGDSDGFVAWVGLHGDVRWLVRVGGPGADQVTGVAVSPNRIAIAGTFTAGADLLGQVLPPFDERSANADAFVAELDAAGARSWAATLGSKANDVVAGVAIDSRERVAVGATVRDVVHVGSADLVAQGAADGLVAWLSPEGEKGPAQLIGGLDFDGLAAVCAVDDRVVVGGFFSGRMNLAGRQMSAGGGDDAFLAAIDERGEIVAGWQVGGDGREEITGLSPIPGGFVAGVAHTANVRIDDVTLPAPADPMTGAAIVVRGVP
ncbi:MAG TPA: hypothetical protein VLX92_07875 [Kofleriaceae bacterium]|nr:hypothetical protein [Kofleriaceae bacterium]